MMTKTQFCSSELNLTLNYQSSSAVNSDWPVLEAETSFSGKKFKLNELIVVEIQA